MQLKSWILDKLNRMDGLLGRPDLPQRNAATVGARPTGGTSNPVSPQPVVEHLGPYGPLIEAIRDELQQFVDGPLRLHLAIAERDRFLLTSIDIGCSEDGEALELLRHFVAEFKPDQIRRFLRREVISALPNAGAIELSQFAGLRILAPPGAESVEGADEYAELLAELRGSGPTADPNAYALTLGGRWVERDRQAPDTGTGADEPARTGAPASPQTPLAGQRLEVDLEDANGYRRISMATVVAGRRYSVGKGEGCDIVVDGTYTSRRHAEFWFDSGSWWLADAGSTNGIRVEVEARVIARSAGQADKPDEQPIDLPAGARIVLSALAEGPPADYPALTLRPAHSAAPPPAPVSRSSGAPTTPITPIVAQRHAGHALMLTAKMASGERSVMIDSQAMPFGIGRSRSQALAIDLAHLGVSGHHLEITSCDEAGADVVVKGDNGVVVDGTSYPAGARFRWDAGAAMVLGRAMPNEPVCTLHLARRP